MWQLQWSQVKTKLHRVINFETDWQLEGYCRVNEFEFHKCSGWPVYLRVTRQMSIYSRFVNARRRNAYSFQETRWSIVTFRDSSQKCCFDFYERLDSVRYFVPKFGVVLFERIEARSTCEKHGVETLRETRCTESCFFSKLKPVKTLYFVISEVLRSSGTGLNCP